MLRGGRSFGSAANWQPVLRMYITPLTMVRTSIVRLLPPFFAGGINGPISAHRVAQLAAVVLDAGRVTFADRSMLWVPRANSKAHGNCDRRTNA